MLKDGAPFSVAAWDSMALNTFVSRVNPIMERHLPPSRLPDFGYLDRLAAPGLRERLLREAGITTLHSEMFSLDVVTPSADAVWRMVSEPVPFGQALETLAEDERETVRNEVMQAMADLRATDGTYRFPMACRIFWGSK